MFKTRFISMLALLAAVVTGAMAQTETLLTTITATAKEQASYSTANVATVSFSYTSGGSSAYLANWGWWGYGWIATVNAAEGYTITKCIFYDDANRTATDSEAPFVVETTEEDKTPRINGTPIDGGNYQSKGIKKIEVYGYAAPATVAVTGVTLAPTTATLTLGETETVTLIPTVLPAEATDKSVTWSSSNEAVATVTDGVVTAVAAGTATITVTTTDGAKTATCAVTVAAPAASTYTVTLKEGTEDATSWTIAPAEATTTGVAAGTTVTATYSGTKKVKSVKAVKKAKPAAVTYIGTKSPTEAKAVGDIVFSDGSATAYTSDLTLTNEQKAAAVAVIFYAGSASDILGAKTLGVGLKNTNEETTKTLAFARNASGTAEGYNTNITAIQCTPSESGEGKAATATFTGDLDGSDNWTALCAAVNDEGTSGNYPAWEWVNAYATTANLTGEYASGWYLPTVAELCMLYRAKDTVNAALEKAGGTKIADAYHWSSSQSSTNSKAWMVKFDSGKLMDTYKGNKWYVCGVRAFN